ncbi:MAG TPA: hypothetical protein VGL63_17530 [Streptosporangiaceae bacterium]|jgi:hypothetical protein
MPDWDAFVACVGGKDTDVSQFLSNEGLNAFNGAKDLAMTGVSAVISYWNQLSPPVQAALKYAEKKLEDAAWKKLGALIAGAGGLGGAAAAAGDIALAIAAFLSALVAGFEIGVLAGAATECLASG